MKLLGSILIALFLLKTMCNVDAKKKKTKSVTTLLEAKWGATPLVLETAEYLADENPNFFWDFVSSISSLNPPLKTIDNDKSQYETILSHASRLLTPLQLSVLKLGLSLHIYSPKVQMFKQIAEERNLPQCSCAADVSGKLTCDLEELDRLIEKPQEDKKQMDLYQVDNHYPGSANRSLAVVLYGELGTDEFAKFHILLRTKAIEGKIDYVIRHYVQDESKKKLRLSGYGVELQMKSTEYKSQDDTEVHQEQNSDESSQEEEEMELEGFDFAKLKKIFPDQKKNLDRFRQFLEESSNELAPLKVWQFQELSLQAAERIMTAPKEETLKIMTNIAQNFPIQAKGLVKTVVKSELKNEMKFNSEIFASNLNVQPSDTALFINGMFYEIDMIDIYGILDVLRQELRIMEGLHKIGIGSKRMSKLLALDFSDDRTQEFAIDIRDSAISWINDIEHESKYSRWSSSLMELLRPTFPGMIRQIRRNLYNLVLVIDPLDPSAAPVLKLIESFVIHSAPIRVGIVFNVTDSRSVSGLDDPGVAMQCAFNYATQAKDGKSALSLVRTILRKAEGRKVTVKDVKEAIRDEFGEDPNDILGTTELSRMPKDRSRLQNYMEFS
ncbi:unnamed protein product [Acanthoscelides obtectus]|uniref:UDP-glucose:glycoprotein glucosyltransferase n=1 Tax=Acanthoscelides obtectus TaxID=200917 RepID=A0A9P0PGI9_ACAOB|nr:unnamed protein product [Acanthoscelides obtectus]CAK1634310.1 UDP-glucose:glycoprotein glucosyltransferase 1 [Acanthoscelides obtectus]